MNQTTKGLLFLLVVVGSIGIITRGTTEKHENRWLTTTTIGEKDADNSTKELVTKIKLLPTTTLSLKQNESKRNLIPTTKNLPTTSTVPEVNEKRYAVCPIGVRDTSPLPGCQSEHSMCDTCRKNKTTTTKTTTTTLSTTSTVPSTSTTTTTISTTTTSSTTSSTSTTTSSTSTTTTTIWEASEFPFLKWLIGEIK